MENIVKNKKGGSNIWRRWGRNIFIFIVAFFTLFILFELLPIKVQKESIVENQLLNQEETKLIKYLEPAPEIPSPQQKLQQQSSSIKNIPENTFTEKTVYPLFKVISNPQVPSYILQGNYVINTISPDKGYIAYLFPDEWETIGDIFIEDTSNKVWTRLVLDQQVRRTMWDNQGDEQARYTPKKKILWLSNEEFLTIIGYAHGTVSTGGDLVKVNWTTGQAEMIYPAYQKSNQEVSDIEILGENIEVSFDVLDPNGFRLDQRIISAPLNNLSILLK